MEAVLAIVVGAASLVWWRRTRRKTADVADLLDTDAQVALHVATHEQRTRDHPTLTVAHLLYGLLQDETIAAAIRATGGALDPLEERVLAALAGSPDHQRTVSADAHEVLSLAVGGAYHHGRKATVTDLWAYLLRTEAAALVELDALAVLHHLVHAIRLPVLADGPGDVLVVIRNDDYTPQEFVTRLLVEVFGLPGEEAREAMLATHHDGRAVFARLPVGVANAKIREARELARSQGFPLWIAAEPV